MRKSLKRALCILLSAAAGISVVSCASPPSPPPKNELKSDTRHLTSQDYSIANLTAVDDYGRTVTVADPSNPDKKYAGMFYFAWLGSQGMKGIYDVNDLEKNNPEALYDPLNKTDSPSWQFHFTSEPLYGYYSMRDPWVIARHMELFTMAGLDYLLFDFTNAVCYNDTAKLVLETARKFKAQGWKVPGIGFYTNSSSRNTVQAVYDNFYKGGVYDDLWFRFEGDARPVIVGISTDNQSGSDQNNPSQVISTDSELYKYFNFYESQWPSMKQHNEEKGFPWMQWGTPIPNDNGFASVSVAQHSATSVFFSDQLPNSSRGYDGNKLTEDWKKGANFQWQFDQMFQYDKAGMIKNVFLTGWNEWTAIKYPAGRHHTPEQNWLGIPMGASPYTGKEVYFVDDYNAEYSRDIELGKEHGDNFYLQMVSNLRKYKMSESEQYLMKTRTFSDLTEFDAWSNVFVEYSDFAGDAMLRDAENAAKVAHTYFDDSYRNDIKTVKAIHDSENIYIYVETVDPITEYNGTDTNWMNLFFSAGEASNSFAGFNYAINRKPGAGGKTSIERCSAAGYNWTEAGSADYAYSGNKMAFRIPLASLGLTADKVSFSFKVADHVKIENDIMDYYVTGDCAPIGRFGFAYGK